MMRPRSVPMTVVIPAKNEELNLAEAIKSVGFAQRVIVVDSQSEDTTTTVAAAEGAEVVQFRYDGGPEKKKNWAIRHLDFDTQWVLILDADERITSDLAEEIASVVSGAEPAVAYALDREFIFLGRQLSCFRPNWNVRLFRVGAAEYEDLGLHDLPGTGDNEIHEHMRVDGPVGYLRSAMLHDDFRGLSRWFERHNAYATWEAEIYRRFRTEPVKFDLNAMRDPLLRKRILRKVWVRLPARPAIRFLVWYFGRGGWRDGREGRMFCYLMAAYELSISAKMLERRIDGLADEHS